MSSRSNVRLASALAVVAALFATGVVAGAAGSAMIIGSELNNAGSANTQLLTNSSVVAFKLLQNGPGTALMGYATPATGGTRGVYGRVDSPDGDGIQARNAAASLGSGAAIHAYGQANIGIIAESTGAVPLKLIAGGGFAPFSTNSSTKVTNLNADLLDGLSSGQFARTDQVQHFTCSAADLLPNLGYLDYEGGFGYRYLTSGAGSLACGLHLPDGATVTSLSGYVVDGTGSAASSCGMYRIPFLSAPVEMALTGASETGGVTPLVDSSITDPIVDNSLNAYSAWCSADGTAGLDLAIVKITVTYTGAP